MMSCWQARLGKLHTAPWQVAGLTFCRPLSAPCPARRPGRLRGRYRLAMEGFAGRSSAGIAVRGAVLLAFIGTLLMKRGAPTAKSRGSMLSFHRRPLPPTTANYYPANCFRTACPAVALQASAQRIPAAS
jgi:hypothetical protein